jgi:hypothetical protein
MTKENEMKTRKRKKMSEYEADVIINDSGIETTLTVSAVSDIHAIQSLSSFCSVNKVMRIS